MACLNNSISLLSTSALSAKFGNSQGRSLWSDTLSMGFNKIFIPEGSVFSPQLALAVGTELFHNILQLILCTDFHGLGLLVCLLHKIFMPLSILVSCLCMIYVRFIDHYSCYLSLTDLIFPTSPEDGNRSNFRKVVFSSILECRIIDKFQRSVFLSVINHLQNPLEFENWIEFYYFKGICIFQYVSIKMWYNASIMIRLYSPTVLRRTLFGR
jgi:hypothetical protein